MPTDHLVNNELLNLNLLCLLVLSQSQEAALLLRDKGNLLPPGLQEVADDQVVLVLLQSLRGLLNQLLLIRLQLEGHHEELRTPDGH